MAKNPTRQQLQREAEAKEARQQEEQQRYNSGDSEDNASGDRTASAKTDPDEFHNYKPPRRLLALEIIVIILLIMLLLINPNGFTAISMKGTDTVGLLSSCSGGTCTSWLGAPAGGPTTATAAPAAALAEKRAPSDSTSTSTSSPTTFHLQTGLAAFCSFILLLYAFAFHLLRLRTTPPHREGRDSDIAERRKTSWLRAKFGDRDFSGFKRFGYRASRLFISADVVLLLCVCISAGVQASSGGFNAGFVLLVIAWILLFLVALIEFLDESRKIRGCLMFKKSWGRRGSEEKKKRLPVHAPEMEQTRPV